MSSSDRVSPNCCACWAASAAASQVRGQPTAQARLSQPELHADRLAPHTCCLLPQRVSSASPLQRYKYLDSLDPAGKQEMVFAVPDPPRDSSFFPRLQVGRGWGVAGWGLCQPQASGCCGACGQAGAATAGAAGLQDGRVKV